MGDGGLRQRRTRLSATPTNNRNSEPLAEMIRVCTSGQGEQPRVTDVLQHLVGRSGKLRRLQSDIATAAIHNQDHVLITGEVGVGKELVAMAVHLLDPARWNKPFVPINCALLQPETASSDLFGHVDGAYTGARGAREGAFEKAHEGTLFLDEIGRLGPGVQGRLLRAAQSGEINPMGNGAPFYVDVRIISATNTVLEVPDLVSRLLGYPINVPPLRERVEDIPILINYFIERLNSGTREWVTISKDAVEYLQQLDLPGNIRDLSKIIGIAAAKTTFLGRTEISKGIIVETLMDYVSASGQRMTTPAQVEEAIDALRIRDERDRIEAALDHSKSMEEAARILGISKTTLYRRIRELGIRTIKQRQEGPVQPIVQERSA